MHMKDKFILPVLLVILLFSTIVNGQEYDLLIKDGHMIDPKNKIDQKMDIAVKDGIIAKVAADIPETGAKNVVDAKGLIVSICMSMFLQEPCQMPISATVLQVCLPMDLPSVPE